MVVQKVTSNLLSTVPGKKVTLRSVLLGFGSDYNTSDCFKLVILYQNILAISYIYIIVEYISRMMNV